MRSILCPVDTSPTLDDRVETALALARTLRGHVTFQIATPFAELALWEPFGGAALSAEAINQVRSGDEKLATRLDRRLATQDVAFDVVVVDEGRIEGVSSASRFADVVVTSLDDPTLEEVGLGVRVPVLAVPRGKPMLAFDKPAVVAWDGSHECADALRSALPLLRLAGAVHLLTVVENPNDLPNIDAASYLSRHDIHARCHEVERDGTIAETIAAFARDHGAGLIVMGLFGKSRLRELLMGGVSRGLLDKAEVPLLLSH